MTVWIRERASSGLGCQRILWRQTSASSVLKRGPAPPPPHEIHFDGCQSYFPVQSAADE